jgi:hypothetical protein
MRHGIRLAPLERPASISSDLCIGGGSELVTPPRFKKKGAVYYGTFGKPIKPTTRGKERRQIAPAAEEDLGIQIAGLSIRQ